jgi:hypothetical protein
MINAIHVKTFNVYFVADPCVESAQCLNNLQLQPQWDNALPLCPVVDMKGLGTKSRLTQLEDGGFRSFDSGL